jgi:hypothetical protein
MNWKNIAFIAVIAIVATAIVFRVSSLKQLVTGSV